eukprot:757215-Hanusia_phi.AAC.1
MRESKVVIGRQRLAGMQSEKRGTRNEKLLHNLRSVQHSNQEEQKEGSLPKLEGVEWGGGGGGGDQVKAARASKRKGRSCKRELVCRIGGWG